MKPRRHRYAEKAADELDALESERAEILDSSTNTSVEKLRKNITRSSNVFDENGKNQEKQPNQKEPKTPVKKKKKKVEDWALPKLERDPHELTITIREGSNKTDKPATAIDTYKPLSDKEQVCRVLTHFSLTGKVLRVARPTVLTPTLQIRLKETFAQLISDGSLITEPVKIQSGGKRKPDLWAHLP